MGAITTAANSAFRDYNTDGVGSSGAFAVLKSGVRTLFATVESWIRGIRGASIASAATLDLSTRTGDYLHITGATGPTTAVTLADGEEVTLVFDSTPTWTNGASLILPTGANIAWAAGDSVVIRGEAAGVVRVVGGQRASGLPFATSAVTGASQELQNLVVTANGAATATATADVVSLINSSGGISRQASLSAALDITLGGVSGLDTGAEGSSTWYHVWAIGKTTPISAQAVTADAATDKITLNAHGLAANTPIQIGGTPPTGLSTATTYYIRDVGTNDFKVAATPNGSAIDLTSAGASVTITEHTALLLSASSTSPTLPSGYTYKRYLGALRNDSSSNFWRTLQRHRRTHIQIGTNPTAPPTMSSGATGSVSVPTWSNITLSAFVPPNAVVAWVIASSTTTSNYTRCVAPNNSAGAANSASNPPPVVTGAFQDILAAIPIESANLYTAGESSTALYCAGWEINL